LTSGQPSAGVAVLPKRMKSLPSLEPIEEGRRTDSPPRMISDQDFQ